MKEIRYIPSKAELFTMYFKNHKLRQELGFAIDRQVLALYAGTIRAEYAFDCGCSD